MAKKKVPVEGPFVKRSRARFEELANDLETMLKHPEFNNAFEDFLLGINSSRYLHFYQDCQELFEKKRAEDDDNINFHDIMALHTNYIEATAVQHLLTDHWVEKDVFEEMYSKMAHMKTTPNERKNNDFLKPVVDECWKVLLEDLHPKFLKSREYQDLHENLEGGQKGLYEISEENGSLGIVMEQVETSKTNQFHTVVEQPSEENMSKSTFKVGVRSAKNVWKWGLPETQTKPKAVPVTYWYCVYCGIDPHSLKKQNI